MQFPVKLFHPPVPQKAFCLGPAAEEAGPVARRQCGHLVEEEQRGIALAHGFMVQALVVEFAADPVLRRPAPFAQRLVRPMKLAAAIAQHGAACRHGGDLAPWSHAVLQGHFWRPCAGGVTDYILVLRKAIRSARWSGFLTPAKGILFPGTAALGSSRYLSRFASSHLAPLAP